MPAEEAPVGHPAEMLPFCGALGMGALGAEDRNYRPAALAKLRSLANDPRWRTREAVAQGLQRLAAASPEETLADLETWILEENWLEMRAVAAGVAEPKLLKDSETAKTALTLHRKILVALGEAAQSGAEDYTTLRKALGYSLSVVVSTLPTQGFVYLRELASSKDRDMRWILKNNLKKARLVRDFPGETEALLRSLD